MSDQQDRAEPIGEAIQQLLNDGAAGTLATIVSTEADSEKIVVGAKLLIKEAGETAGSLGDPALDKAVADFAPTFLRSRDATRLLKVTEFAPELRQHQSTGVLIERIETEPRLVIAGAGHVGASLARLGALVGYRVTLIDDRAEFVTRELFASPNEQAIELVTAKDWSNAMRLAIANGSGVSVAIVTRGHKQDEDCLRATIGANPDYIGMIGSKRRTNIVIDKLREEGANENALTKVRAPIGLDIGAVSPEEVALAILAEIVGERRGGSGQSLSAWRRISS
jgi:xanthine dehydrogenase accessory factor